MRSVDAEMPLMEAIRSDERIIELLNQQVVPRVYPGCRITKLSARRMSYSRGERCTVLYKYRLEPTLPAERAVPHYALLTFAANDSLENEYRQYAASETLPVALLRDAGVLVEFFPMDWKLPGLRLATDMSRMQTVLSKAMETHGAAVVWSYELRRYHPRVRCVLEYGRTADGDDSGRGATAPESAGSAVKAIGKTYARAAKAARTWSVLESVNELARAARHWRTPMPLAYERAANLILLEYMQGQPIADLLCEGNAQRGPCVEAVRRAARVLVELHRMPITGFALRTSEEARRKTFWRSSRIETLDPALARRITAVLEEIAARCAQFPCTTTTFVHGSPSPKQFLLDGERIALLDFDGARLGDPAADLGVFLASLCKYELKASDRRVLNGLGEHFLDEYRKRGGDGGIVRRAQLIQSQELVGYAARNFLRRIHKYDAAKSSQKRMRLLDEATACLASL